MPRGTILPKLAPLNALSLLVKMTRVDPASGKRVDFTSGTVRAFIATSKALTATPLHPSLDIDAVYTGRGKWLVQFDPDILVPSILDPAFASGSATPYVIVEEAGSVREYVECEYEPERRAVVG